jgi:uncharacterized alkaline shock family protein YloU
MMSEETSLGNQSGRGARLLSLRPDAVRRHAPSPHGDEQPGVLRIARRVIRTVIEEATLATPGVARLAEVGPQWPQVLGRPVPRHGIGLIIHGEQVIVDVYVVVRPDANMVAVGSRVQESIQTAIEHLLGMTVSAVNVFIRDVA